MPKRIGWTACLWVFTAIALAAASATAQSGAGATLQQYKSGGQVLGFGPGGYYLSNGTYALMVEFVGAAPVAPTEDAGHGEAGGGAAPLGRVRYGGLWKGISVQYEAPAVGIARSTWRLEPGAKPSSIRLRYNRPVSLNPDGSLTVAASATAVLSESAPVAWQEIDGKRRPVQVAFAIRGTPAGGGEVGFALGAYDQARPLEIDPTLQWNTFMGGESVDYGNSIAVDGSGNVYVIGNSNATWGNPVRAFTPDFPTFVAKLDGASGSLVWNTFLGGSEVLGSGIAVDGTGNVYVVGASDGTWGGPVRAYTAGFDAYVAKLDAASGELLWNTFLGGSGDEFGNGIAVDRSGNVYVTGDSNATWGSPLRTYAAGLDAFAARLDAASGTLLWNTFLGGSEDDAGHGIAVDGSGNVYVTGTSGAAWGSPVRAFMAGFDAFAAKLDAATGALVWNTFLGGSGYDFGSGIAADGSGNLYVSGFSDATWASPVRAYTAGLDVFAAKLDAASGALVWSTFLGSSGDDYSYGIAVDGSGNVYVTGYGDATWGSPVQPYAMGNETFAVNLNPASGALVWSTFLGGSGQDFSSGIATDGSGNVYLTGLSGGTWGIPVRPYTTDDDAFVAKLGPSASEIPTLRSSGLALLALLLAAVATNALRRRIAR